jgi:5-methylcytosine-specific restriction endonuclease McrA
MKMIINAIKDRVSGKVPLLKKRSSKWPKVRAEWLSKNGTCAACGQSDHLQVHHIKPFHIDRSLELEESNFITLCEDEYDCHRVIGHLGNFRKENPNVIEDAKTALRKRLEDEALNAAPGTQV